MNSGCEKAVATTATALPEVVGRSDSWHPTFQVYHSKIFNTGDSAGQWRTMMDAGMAAARRMKSAGQHDFKINIEAGSSYSQRGVAERSFQAYVRTAAACVSRKAAVNTLSDEEKFAICVACKVPLVTESGDGLTLKVRTATECGIVWDDEVNGYHVYQRPIMEKAIERGVAYSEIKKPKEIR